MKRNHVIFRRRTLFSFIMLLNIIAASKLAAADSWKLYQQHCASCHGSARYGGSSAPPLIPQMLGNKSEQELQKLIQEGLPATQMSGFAKLLSAVEIQGLVSLLLTPTADIHWDLAEISQSRELFPDQKIEPMPAYDRKNTILVVERGTESIAVFDGNELKQWDQYKAGKIHGGPKFDQTYQNVYAVTRDGILTWYHLESRQLRAKIKVAVNTRNIAISPQGTYVVAANQLPQSLVILDGQLNPVKIFSLEGKPSAVYHLPEKARFILTLQELPVLLYLDYTPSLQLTRVTLPEVFQDFMFVPGKNQIIASSRQGQQILLYDLDQEKILGSVETRGLPHLFSAAFFEKEQILYVALNHIGLPQLTLLEMRRFQKVREIPLKGSGYFVRTHPGTPYLWVDTNTEEVQLVDKTSFQLLPQGLIPASGKKAMHIEFTANGQQALISVWHPQGAVVVYNAASLQEITRFPFNMPIGKYNAFNKTH